MDTDRKERVVTTLTPAERAALDKRLHDAGRMPLAVHLRRLLLQDLRDSGYLHKPPRDAEGERG